MNRRKVFKTELVPAVTATSRTRIGCVQQVDKRTMSEWASGLADEDSSDQTIDASHGGQLLSMMTPTHHIS